jgi:hypothetical protein
MRLMELEPSTDRPLDLHGKRVLIFVVAYNAESTIEKVLSRIPRSLQSDDVEVLIIDDSSQDATFRNGVRFQCQQSAFKITVLRTPQNQGYGGNQKLGYRYAIDNGFDIVALAIRAGEIAGAARAPRGRRSRRGVRFSHDRSPGGARRWDAAL